MIKKHIVSASLGVSNFVHKVVGWCLVLLGSIHLVQLVSAPLGLGPQETSLFIIATADILESGSKGTPPLGKKGLVALVGELIRHQRTAVQTMDRTQN